MSIKLIVDTSKGINISKDGMPKELDISFVEKSLPWKPLEVPEIETGDYGKWFIKDERTPIARGYFQGLQLMDTFNPVLVEKETGNIYMSATPMELESQVHHAYASTGHVVVGGGGLGVFLYNIAKKKSVKKITVIEQSSDIIDLLLELMRRGKWKGRSKIRFIHNSIFEVSRKHIRADIDFLYVDIWPNLMSKEALPDTQRIYKKLKAKVVGYWGQELDFIHYAHEQEYLPPPTKEQYREWVKSTGMPLLTIKDHYYWAYEAAKQVAQY